MTALITRALYSGFTSNQILGMLVKQYPQYKDKIEKALAIGYGADKIIQQITKDKKGQPTISNEFLTESERQSKLERENKGFRNKAAGTAALVAGGVAASMMPGAAQAALGGIQGMLGGGQPQGPSPTPSPMQKTPGQAIGQQVQSPGGMPQVPVPPLGQQAPQQVTQQDVETNPNYQPDYDFLKKKDLIPKIQTMVKAGKSKEQIVDMLKKKMPMMEQEYLRTLGPGGREVDLDTKLGDMVDKYFQPSQPVKPVKLEKGSEVITPDGDIANIEALPGKTAKVDIDGRKNVYETDDLTPIPENKDEILSIYDKLIEAIPESARSTMVSAIGYDPKNNKAQVKFHDGTSYVYEDIDEEDVNSIINLENLAKTTGGNYFGVYFEGEPSLGAGMSKLIKRLQEKYGGKGKEYSGKFKEVYSLYAIPEGKRREREKAEREAKKKAKRPS